MISSVDLIWRASSMVCWASRTSHRRPAAQTGTAFDDVDANGMTQHLVITQIETISFTADSKSPARGAIAPRSPSIPARQFSGSSQGRRAGGAGRRCRVPQNGLMVAQSRGSYRVILSPRAPPIQVPDT